MDRTTTLLAAAFALTLGGVPAYAADSGMDPASPGTATDGNANSGAVLSSPSQSTRDAFNLLDKKHAGKISRSEARSNVDLSKNFDKYDINKDGYIEEGEFARFEADQGGSTGGSSNSPGGGMGGSNQPGSGITP